MTERLLLMTGTDEFAQMSVEQQLRHRGMDHCLAVDYTRTSTIHSYTHQLYGLRYEKGTQ